MNLKEIFGPESSGKNPQDFAATSKNEYVRSQVQIALATPEAGGRRLSAVEALYTYGLRVLETVAENGAAPLIKTRDEPATTLRRRREDLKLDIKDVAKQTGLDVEVIKSLETAGKASKIRHIEKLAVALALDERRVGMSSHDADRDLGVRLRELRSDRDAIGFDATSVLKLAEAGWVISRQNELERLLQIRVDPIISEGSLRSDDYSYVAAEKGYALADKVRKHLGLKADEPIESLRKLLETRLAVPLIQDKLSRRFAGATIANGASRGIIVNEEGHNERVWTRRMTLAHEIGHLVGDPDPRLNKLRVDHYDRLGKNLGIETDNVERRANGFAVAFLAPPEAVRSIAQKASSLKTALETVMNKYGISKTAAIFHIQNVAKLDMSKVDTKNLKDSSEEWQPQENLTLDYFPIEETPLNRRGRFASLVVMAEKAGHISEDTAASYLNTLIEKYRNSRDTILALQN
ncbi:XRE family transcriptional regulator [Agrobacterium rosae]|uniref:XRE family transcriptional regulator n=1 Tax=Agrobacterium rosae TaxID=1972867 RepID=UPI002A0CCA8A|nr:XRE family transcriptional regulator [Agrobacterium rosae]MDX8317104.1 XRE family transcriptional regulator [Agrobacterium rosae]